MSQPPDSEWTMNEQMSALVDGELPPHEQHAVLSAWRMQASARATWHAYQLIGDVLRSDELTGQGADGDAAFLAAVRHRLASEPVVLAPAVPAASARLPRGRTARKWAGSVAVAAGFAAVVGVVSVMQMDGSRIDTDAPAFAAQQVDATTGAMRVVNSGTAPRVADAPPTVQLNGRLIRDARLDEYLAAHKKFGGSSAPGVPSGFLRNAAVDGSSR